MVYQVCKQKTYCCNQCWPRLSPEEEDQLKNEISTDFCHVDGCWKSAKKYSNKCTFCEAGRISHLNERRWNGDLGWELQEAQCVDTSCKRRRSSQLALENGDASTRASGSRFDRGAVESMPTATLSNMLEDMHPSELCDVLVHAAGTLKRKLDR